MAVIQYPRPLGGDLVDGDKSDIIVSSGGSTWTIDTATVTTVKLADSSVTLSKMADNSVGALTLLDGAVISAKLGDNSVTTDKLATDAVTTLKIADLSITTSKLIDNSVTTAKLADSSVTNIKLATDAVDTLNILNDAVTTLKIVDSAITANKLATNAITTIKITDDAVTTSKIADNTITTVKLADNTISTAKIQDNAVTDIKIADTSITTAKIVNNAVTGTKLADGSVTDSKLTTDSVTSTKILNQSVTTAKLNDAAVTTDKIADHNVTFSKLPTSTTASLLLGRGGAAGAGHFEEITLGSNLVLSGTQLQVQAGLLTDGDKGDITVSSGGAVWTIDNNAITTTKIANATVTLAKLSDATATSVLLGRNNSTTGSFEQITLGTNLAISGTTLNASFSIADGDKGDITVSSSGTVWTVDNSAITTAKIASNAVTLEKLVAATAPSLLLGRTDASAGNFQEITLDADTLSISGTTLSSTVADANKGDLTVSGGGVTWQINNAAITTAKVADDAITLEKLANATTTSILLGRRDTSTGAYEEISLGTNLSISGTTLNVNTTVPDGDKGDITVASSGTVWTIDSGAITTTKIADGNVTFAKLPDATGASKLLGRGDSGAGDFQEITLGTGLVINGTQLAFSGGILNDGDKGDISVSGTGTVWTIDNSAITTAKIADSNVTLAKIQDSTATSILLGRNDSTTGPYQQIALGTRLSISGTVLNVDTTIPDGDKGDITTASSGALWTIDNDAIVTSKIANEAVTFSKIQHSTSASKLVGRGSGVAGVFQEITLDSTLSMIGTTLSALVADGDKGDITVSSSGTVWTIDNGAISTAKIADNAVTLAKIQDATATSILLGRNNSTTGPYQQITLGTRLSISGTVLNVDTTLSDGDRGDITVSSSGTVWTIDNNAITTAKIADDNVTLAKLENSTGASLLLGRGSAAGAGNFQEISLGTGFAMTGTTLDYTLPDGDRGDIVVSSGGTTWTLEDNSVTTAKVLDNNITLGKLVHATSGSRLLGRGSSGTGDFEEITLGSSLGISGTVLSVAIPLTDGDKGDITVSSSGTVFSIDNSAVTTAKLADDSVTLDKLLNATATSVLLGRNNSTTGAFEQITLGTGLSISGTVLNSTVVDGDKGSITVSSGGTVWTLDNDTVTTTKIVDNNVTLAKLQDATATSVLLGRRSTSTGDFEQITLGTKLAMTNTVLDLAPNALDPTVTIIGIGDLVSNEYTASTVSNQVLVYTAATQATIFLPNVSVGTTYYIKNNSSYTLTIDANGSETIDGDLTLVSTGQYDSFKLIKLTSTEWGIF
jgi:hypothetical protein